MKHRLFCDKHIEAFFHLYEESKKPLDLSLSNYFKNHKSLGANDRRYIGETVFGMVRWKSLLDVLCSQAPITQRLEKFRSIDWESIQHDSSIPPFARLGTSPFLYERFVASFGLERSFELCRILNTPAPTTIRVNTLKISREELVQRWHGKFSVSNSKIAPHGIHFSKREPLFSLPEFKEGLFEIQDEGSQLVSNLIEASPDDLVLDYCSGSGGKTLGFAPAMKNKGQIYLHDIRSSALIEAKRRLKRAGIQNAQCLPPGHSQLNRLKGKCSWVLVDAPCSGTGTLRRNPDQKWKIDQASVKSFTDKQREILKNALTYLKPGGRLVYATCSLLPEENTEQIPFLLANHSIELEKPPLCLFPEPGGMDGFFAAVFRKKNL